MTKEKREKVIKIRVHNDELSELKAKCTKAELATWMREFCLSNGSKNIPQKQSVDPQLLRQLAGIGNNLNQITRRINSSDKPALEKIQIIAALSKIEESLKAINVKQNT